SAVTTADQKKLGNMVSGDLVQLTNEQVVGNGKRFLRSHKVVDDDDDDNDNDDDDDDDDESEADDSDDDETDSDEEERGGGLFSIGKIAKLMGSDETYLFQKMAAWKEKGYTPSDILSRLGITMNTRGRAQISNRYASYLG
ncbi:hypothetical protein JM16_007914, partial [Phytophthora kernoviae]